jgi:ribonuclease HI
MAIWSIFLVVPCNTEIVVCTDSSAAIQGIEKGRCIQHKGHWLKIKNQSIISNIVYLEKIKILKYN